MRLYNLALASVMSENKHANDRIIIYAPGM